MRHGGNPTGPQDWHQKHPAGTEGHHPLTHIQNIAPKRIQQANLINQDIQEVIDNATEKELEAEQKQ